MTGFCCNSSKFPLGEKSKSSQDSPRLESNLGTGALTFTGNQCNIDSLHQVWATSICSRECSSRFQHYLCQQGLSKKLRAILLDGLSSHMSRNNKFMQIQLNGTRYQVATRSPQCMKTLPHVLWGER